MKTKKIVIPKKMKITIQFDTDDPIVIKCPSDDTPTIKASLDKVVDVVNEATKSCWLVRIDVQKTLKQLGY